MVERLWKRRPLGGGGVADTVVRGDGEEAAAGDEAIGREDYGDVFGKECERCAWESTFRCVCIKIIEP